MWFRHTTDWACCFARAKEGNSRPARIAMIAITTKSSISVNAVSCLPSDTDN